MHVLLLILFGFAAGVVGGMGMGGGTLLVPLLSFLDMEQKSVQAINLLSFLPMCCIALAFHGKGGLLKTKNVFWLILPAAITSAVGAFVTNKTPSKWLKIVFGSFLIAVGVWQLCVAIVYGVKVKKSLAVVDCSSELLNAKKDEF